MHGPTDRYAAALFGRRVSPWRDSRPVAIDDAVRLGHASRDPWPRGPTFWSIGAGLIVRRKN